MPKKEYLPKEFEFRLLSKKKHLLSFFKASKICRGFTFNLYDFNM